MTKTTIANDRMNRPLDSVDPQIADLLRDEARRQATGLELIPSENLVSEAVLEAMGSIFTNKYAEGYPGKRYYGGCEYADKVEQLAIDRAKELFGAEHANVQAHSGTSANVAVYMSLLQPGDTEAMAATVAKRSEEHTSELQSLRHLVCRLLLEKKKKRKKNDKS